MTRNQWTAPCRKCSKLIRPGEGVVQGKPGHWTAIHDECVPVADTARYGSKQDG